MDKIVVTGGHKLKGEVFTSGSKNAALPLLFASLLAEGKHVFYNVPFLQDIESTSLLLHSLGCKTYRDGNAFIVEVGRLVSKEAGYDLVRKMRASILCLGPLLSRYGEAVVSLPGGCAIGSRPIDLHIDGMSALGAQITVDQGCVHARTDGLRGSTVLFETSTVGGTENIMMAATLADGTTVIENAAKEPEIVDLANYLIKMGAKIRGAGTSSITIEGVDLLRPAEYTVMPDRIEAGTLLLAGAITGGEVKVSACAPQHLEALIVKLRESGFKIDQENNALIIREAGEWNAVDINTAPYPLFPTDLQAQFTALMTQANGTSVITETVFENRFMHIQELSRLNADITPRSRVAVVRGHRGQLKGAPVMATDLRASACLVLAGLVCQGETTVNRIYHLDRGYERLESKLSSLGAKIVRLKE